jgi:hypothetical protein
VCSVVGVNDIEEGEGDDSDEELFWDDLLLYSVDNSMYLDVQIIHYKNIRLCPLREYTYGNTVLLTGQNSMSR